MKPQRSQTNAEVRPAVTQKLQTLAVYLLAAASVGLWGYTAFHGQDMGPFLERGAYYGMLTLFLAWVYTGVQDLQARSFSAGAFLRRYGPGLLFCLFVSVLIYVSVKPSFKTLGDETNLLSTSRSMVFAKKGVNDLMGIRSFGDFNSLATAIDQRPFLFPFLESVLHTVRGFDPANAFLLNGFLMFLFLSAIFICARQYFNGVTSAGAVVLAASNPLFSIYGTSGGFDLLSCFCFGFSMILVYSYVENASSERFALVWTTLLLFANTRYESFIFFFVVLGILAVMGRVKGEYLKANRVLVAMTPLWFLVIAWSRLVNFDFIQDPGVSHIFGLSSFQANLANLLQCQLDFHFRMPYNNVLNLAAVAIALYLFWMIVVRRKAFQKPEQLRMAFILSVSIGIYLVIVLSHYAGISSSSTNARYYLPFTAACALAPLFWLATFTEEARRALSIPFLLVSLALFALYHPIAVEGRFINRLGPNLEIYFAHDYLKEHYPDKQVLVIAEWPTEYTALEYGAMSFYTANAAAPRVLSGLQRHTYQDVIVIQQILYATGAPVPEQALRPAFPLQTLSEYETQEDRFIRISKVRIGPAQGSGATHPGAERPGRV